jgi:hypothetical protein
MLFGPFCACGVSRTEMSVSDNVVRPGYQDLRIPHGIRCTAAKKRHAIGWHTQYVLFLLTACYS